MSLALKIFSLTLMRQFGLVFYVSSFLFYVNQVYLFQLSTKYIQYLDFDSTQLRNALLFKNKENRCKLNTIYSIHWIQLWKEERSKNVMSYELIIITETYFFIFLISYLADSFTCHHPYPIIYIPCVWHVRQYPISLEEGNVI